MKHMMILAAVAAATALPALAGGKYAIVEADRIIGSFATVLKPKSSWKVEYVSEEIDGETVVTRIDLTVPVKGLAVSIR